MNPEECECNVDVASRLPGYSHALDLDNLTETKNITCLCLTQKFYNQTLTQTLLLDSQYWNLKPSHCL